MNAPDARLVLIRHGETEWSKSGQHTSRADIALTEVGEAQARAIGPTLAGMGLRQPLVITSPRQRATRTAHLAGLAPDRTWDDLVEWDYGNYEGRTTVEIRENVPHWTVWSHPCPGGESMEAVQSRADTVLSVVTPQLADRDVVLVGHGHFSRVLIARWADLPVAEGRRFAMSAGSISTLGYEHGVPQVVTLNECRGNA